MALLVAILGAFCCGVAARADTPFTLTLPTGFPPPVIPADNPLTWERVELGRLLFYDTRLSLNETYSCATCHQQALAFTDGRDHAVGSTGQIHPRSSMSLTNVVYASSFTWADKTTPSLEEQMLVPLFTETPIVELGMGGKEDELFARLQADTRYQRMFAEAFPGETDLVRIETITKAIASFERTLISGNSPYDRYSFGVDDNAISASAKHGEHLFFDDPASGRLRECLHCHAGFNFTTSLDANHTVTSQAFQSNALYNLNCASQGLPDLALSYCAEPPGTPMPSPTPTCAPDRPCHRCDGPDPQTMGCYPRDNTGLYAKTGKPDDMGHFKAPTLRNIAVTAPYMHDGSLATLEDVVDHYAAGGRTISSGEYAGDGSKSPVATQFMGGFTLSGSDRADLISFLSSLTDEDFLSNPRFSDPYQPVTCPGDCNLDGTVDVSDLVTSINVSLGTSSLALCLVGDPSGDGTVTIDELVRAISGALYGCA